jgi:hypothetical protein
VTKTRLVIATVIVAWGAIGATPCFAQTRVSSLDELRQALAAGDVVTIIPGVGQPVTGRLLRLGQDDLDLRLDRRRTGPDPSPRHITIPLNAIQSLDRPRDSARNGARLGAGIGAGVGGAMFLYALAIDRNEIDEWAASYAVGTAICTGIGALIGWSIDKARSKPPIRFDVQPVLTRDRGIRVAVSFSR